MTDKILIVGLIGPFGSGKTTVSSHLEEKGFLSIRLSSFIEDEIINNNLGSPKDRKLLQDVGNNLRKKFGGNVLAARAIKLGLEKRSRKIVVDGIRNISELKFLKKKGRCFILGITADINSRYNRLKKLKSKKLISKHEFIRLETREKGKGQKNNGLQSAKCWELKDYEIENDGTKEDLKNKIEEFLKSIN